LFISQYSSIPSDKFTSGKKPYIVAVVFVAIYGVITSLQALTMFINVKLWFNFSILAVFIVF
jgi:hypothetical protein